jgi:deoxyribodipyrimidine photolyase
VTTTALYWARTDLRVHDNPALAAAADYVTRWCPELAGLPPETAHAPWRLSDDEQVEYDIIVGNNYPKTVVETTPIEK